ncbi:MAG TPA: redoxin family protein [Bryobacteraceae bacterium]|nr:redoxin family protein [Bryobacteraceae bacterium]
MQNLSEQQKFGEALPDFSLRTLDGETANIGWVLGKKKGAVIVVWSSTCSHCIRYDKYFNGFGEQYPDIGLLIVSSRNGEELDAVRRAAAQRKLKFPIVHDPASIVAGEWFTRQTPRAFLIDANGALLYRGAVDNYKYSDDPEYVAYLDPALAQFLQGKPVEKQETASYGCAIQSVYYTLPKAL